MSYVELVTSMRGSKGLGRSLIDYCRSFPVGLTKRTLRETPLKQKESDSNFYKSNKLTIILPKLTAGPV